jgi:hypothetical protein
MLTLHTQHLHFTHNTPLSLFPPTHTHSTLHVQSISSAPTGTNIIPYGDMEGEESYITNRWPSKCTTNVVNINNTTDPSLVYSGEQSLYATGGRCFVMRQLGVCPSGRLEEAVNAGDLLRIAFMVKLMDPGQVFQVSTAHYHAGKERAWSFPDDHSNIIARTHIPNANTWTKVVAYHRVGPDWTYGQPRTLLPPETCSAYQLRFMVSGSDSDFVLDDVRIEKVASPADTAALSEAPPVIGFISNPITCSPVHPDMSSMILILDRMPWFYLGVRS